MSEVAKVRKVTQEDIEKMIEILGIIDEGPIVDDDDFEIQLELTDEDVLRFLGEV